MFRVIRRVLNNHPNCKTIYSICMNAVVCEAAKSDLDDYNRIHIMCFTVV